MSGKILSDLEPGTSLSIAEVHVLHGMEGGVESV